MLHVFWTQKWIWENISDLCDSAIFHFAFHSTTISNANGSDAFKPILSINSDYLCPFTSKITIWQCVMMGNVIEWEGSELKWWLPFWSGVPSTAILFVLPYIAMISISNVFVISYEKYLFKLSKNKLLNWKFGKGKFSMAATHSFALFIPGTAFSSIKTYPGRPE